MAHSQDDELREEEALARADAARAHTFVRGERGEVWKVVLPTQEGNIPDLTPFSFLRGFPAENAPCATKGTCERIFPAALSATCDGPTPWRWARVL